MSPPAQCSPRAIIIDVLICVRTLYLRSKQSEFNISRRQCLNYTQCYALTLFDIIIIIIQYSGQYYFVKEIACNKLYVPLQKTGFSRITVPTYEMRTSCKNIHERRKKLRKGEVLVVANDNKLLHILHL